MIKYLAGDKDGKNNVLLGFALSEENVRLLWEGRPIVIDLDEVGVKIRYDGQTYDGSIIIHYGETEEAMAKELSEIGLIDPSAKVAPGGGG